MTRPRIKVNWRKTPAHGELCGAVSLVWAGRNGEQRPCLDAVLDDGRRVFIRLARDGSRVTDPDVARALARTLLTEADRSERPAAPARA